MVFTIYALTDPTTGERRFVGLTRKEPRQRLKSHIRDSHSRPWQEVQLWVKELAESGCPPGIEVLEQFESDDYDGVEAARRQWAAKLAAGGERLLNAM